MTPAYEVAVKMPKPGSPSSIREDLMAEALISAQLVHANVVMLIGVVTVRFPILLVIQMCSRGSLQVGMMIV